MDNPPPSMPSQTHDLKVRPEFFDAIVSGEKTFEFRKDDREPRFAVGDVLRLREWLLNEAAAFPCGMYSGAELFRRVRYIARSSPLIPDGFCCMSLGEVASLSVPPGEDVTTDYASGFAAAIDQAVDLTQWHGCISGDCPHAKWTDCEAAIIAQLRTLTPRGR